MRYLLLIPLFAILISCGNNESATDAEFQVINLDNSDPIDFKISDFITDPVAVSLETNDSSVVEGNFWYLFSDEYIIVVDRNQISQFDIEGNFIGILAKSGGGPYEFNNLNEAMMSHDSKRLIIAHYGNQNALIAYGLNGENPETIPVPDRPTSLFVDVEGYIDGFSSFGAYFYYRIDPQGDVTDSLMWKRDKENSMSRGMAITRDKEGYLIMKEADTLYRFSNKKLEPILSYQYEDAIVLGTGPGKGYMLFAGYTTDEYLYPVLTELEVTSDNGIMINGDGNRSFKVNRITGQVENFESINLGFFDISLGRFNPHIINDRALFTISPPEWLEAIENRENPTPEQQKLIDQVGEVGLEDNPIIIIGEIK